MNCPTSALGVRRIAVLRANAVGDFILTLPALAALRARYPTAHLVLLGRAWHARLLRGRPGPVDEVVVTPLDQPERHAEFLARMRDRGFDLAVQLHGGGRTANPFLRQCGARLTVGLQARDAVPLDRNLRYDPQQPVILHLLEAVGLAGAPAVGLTPRFSLTVADQVEAGRVLGVATDAEQGAAMPPWVVLQPGASDPRRRWSASRFAALGDALAARGWRIAVHGAAHERALVTAVRAALRVPGPDLCGRLSLGGLAAVLARSALLVGSDSGPVHLARAVGTPTVVVQWIGNLRPWGSLAAGGHRAAVSWQLDCPVCGARNVTTRCAHDVSFVDAVTVEEVLSHALDLLAVRQ